VTAPLRVMHRLALVVLPIDAGTGRAAEAVGVVRETLRGPRKLDPGFKLRHGRGIGDRVTIRIDDVRRRWAPRRFDVALRTVAEVSGDPYIPAVGRLLRPWLLPGAAWSPPWGTTVVRGTVAAAWPRIIATDEEGEEVGWAHGDERGEFQLVVRRAGRLQVAPPPELALSLAVHVPADPAAEPVAEPVARATGQPAPDTPEDDVLRGIAVPAGYILAATVPVTVFPGEPTKLPPISVP
jgi:hypothetical protein